mmetsp:Transcript_27494/g.64461  ORF Transcript_27494/g.64461 Transcript_27494/m.64461 type:complete len:113 (-) Transcript_27494:350-688(-)
MVEPGKTMRMSECGVRVQVGQTPRLHCFGNNSSNDHNNNNKSSKNKSSKKTIGSTCTRSREGQISKFTKRSGFNNKYTVITMIHSSITHTTQHGMILVDPVDPMIVVGTIGS